MNRRAVLLPRACRIPGVIGAVRVRMLGSRWFGGFVSDSMVKNGIVRTNKELVCHAGNRAKRARRIELLTFSLGS